MTLPRKTVKVDLVRALWSPLTNLLNLAVRQLVKFVMERAGWRWRVSRRGHL